MHVAAVPPIKAVKKSRRAMPILTISSPHNRIWGAIIGRTGRLLLVGFAANDLRITDCNIRPLPGFGFRPPLDSRL
jgi:hypothetical protein